jgi:hypothetical protein
MEVSPMGRLQLIIIGVIYIANAIVGAVSAAIQIYTSGRLATALPLVVSLVPVGLLFWLNQGARWARLVLGAISTLAFFVLVLVGLFVGGLGEETLLILIVALAPGWCAYVLFFSKSLKRELELRRQRKEALDSDVSTKLEAEELRHNQP